ncbi:MAG: threonine/serine exporter family protein [Eubacteriales bacterium]|nr:threonine/serine exporter family protein [Eubacteriales bacterium]MDD4421982.1 threonine/serine exporter family protein [Eubacteriales bacterium]
MFDEYLTLSLKLSSAMLKNGGETYRAEECARNILASGGATEIEVLALPTGLSVTAVHEGMVYTRVLSLKSRDNNLGNIDILNTISREVSAGKLLPAEALERISQIDSARMRPLIKTIFACISAASFTVMFGGGFYEFAFSLLIAFISQLFIAFLSKIGSLSFFSNMGGSMMTAVLARICCGFFPELNMAVIIIGGIIPLLPGLATINAIRDTLYGDLVSGAARGVEALLSAISIAAGIALVLSIGGVSV